MKIHIYLVWLHEITDLYNFYLFLREDFRKGYQEQNPDVKSMRDVFLNHLLLVSKYNSISCVEPLIMSLLSLSGREGMWREMEDNVI